MWYTHAGDRQASMASKERALKASKNEATRRPAAELGRAADGPAVSFLDAACSS